MIPKKLYKKRLPTKAKRGKFSDKTIEDILERDNGLCVICHKVAVDIHHIKFKSQNGRGVFTNGVSLCRDCHALAHSKSEVNQSLVDIAVSMYGGNYYKDKYDN